MYLEQPCEICEKPKYRCKCDNNPGWYWDHVNKTFYRWYDLMLLYKERERKGLHQQNPQKAS